MYKATRGDPAGVTVSTRTRRAWEMGEEMTGFVGKSKQQTSHRTNEDEAFRQAREKREKGKNDTNDLLGIDFSILHR